MLMLRRERDNATPSSSAISRRLIKAGGVVVLICAASYKKQTKNPTKL